MNVNTRLSFTDFVLSGQEGVLSGHEGVLSGQEGVLNGQEGVLNGQEGVLSGQDMGKRVCSVVMQQVVSAPAGETVAVKSVDASNFRSIAQIDQIQDEISVLSGLKHPCIIRLLDMHFTNNIFYFVMEYAAGGCLVDYVRTQVSTTAQQ